MDMDCIKLYMVRNHESAIHLRVWRGTEIRHEYGYILDQIDKLLKDANLEKLSFLKVRRRNIGKQHNFPHMVNALNLQLMRYASFVYFVKYNDRRIFEYLNKLSIFYDAYECKPVVFYHPSLKNYEWSKSKSELWMCLKWIVEDILHTLNSNIPISEAKNYNFINEKEMFRFLNQIEQTGSWIRLVRISNKVTCSWRLQIERSYLADKHRIKTLENQQQKPGVNICSCVDCRQLNIDDQTDQLHKLGIWLKDKHKNDMDSNDMHNNDMDNYEEGQFYLSSQINLFGNIK